MRLPSHAFAVCALLAVWGGQADAASPEKPAAYCASVRTDDTLRSVSPALAKRGGTLFDVQPQAAAMLQWRCMDSAVWICSPGANLPCGKADTATAKPAAAEWCQAHPGDFIPMYVTGHDSPYEWSCKGARAVHSNPSQPLDSRGFFKVYWKRLPRP